MNNRFLMLTAAMCLVLSGCDSSGSSQADPVEPPEPPVPEAISSCERLAADVPSDNAGVLSVQLPLDLQAGQRVELRPLADHDLLSFDESSATVSITQPSARHPIPIQYDVFNVENELVREHTHTVVFAPYRIMPFGDSITSGVEFFDGVMDLPELPFRVGYRKALYDNLLAEGYEIDYLGQGGQRAGADAGLADPDNNGFPGVDISFLRSKLNEVLAENPTDAFLVHIGTNNTPDDAAELMALLDEIDVWESQHHPVTVLLATIVPARKPDDNARIDQFNADLRNRVQARVGDRLELVEQNLAVTIDDISLEELGKHPSAGGYLKMADTWYASLINSETLARCLP